MNDFVKKVVETKTYAELLPEDWEKVKEKLADATFVLDTQFANAIENRRAELIRMADTIDGVSAEIRDSLKNAIALEDKKYWFSRFWQENFPAPDSTKNPIQEEYFSRVRYANRKFYEGVEGWRTDRGRIYILYGQPNDIERSMDDMMRRYEIWIYHNLDRRYIFIQSTSNDVYRLIR